MRTGSDEMLHVGRGDDATANRYSAVVGVGMHVGSRGAPHALTVQYTVACHACTFGLAGVSALNRQTGHRPCANAAGTTLTKALTQHSWPSLKVKQAYSMKQAQPFRQAGIRT